MFVTTRRFFSCILSRDCVSVSGVVRILRKKEKGGISSLLQLVVSGVVERGASYNSNNGGRVKLFKKSYATTGPLYSQLNIEDIKNNKIMPLIEKKPFSRLPTDVRPYHYDISLAPDLAKFTFNGKEKIYIHVSIVNINFLIVYT